MRVSSRLIQRRKVDFPEPEEPMREITSPLRPSYRCLEHFVGAKILVQITNFQCGNVAHPLQPCLSLDAFCFSVTPTVHLTKC